MQRRKKLLFAALTLCGLVVILEALSWLTATMVDGTWFSFARYEERREKILGEASTAEVTHRGPDPAQELGVGDITGGREVIHPYLGFVFNPEINTREKRRERGQLLVTPEGFFRSPNPAPEVQPPDLSIGIFGGSVALILAFQGQERLLQQLRASPAFAGRRIAVRCFALGGYKQPQQLLTLAYLLSTGEHFDVVINIDGFNELALSTFDNYRHGVYPFYPRAWKQRVDLIPDREFQVKVARLAIERDRRARLARLATRWRFSITVNLVWSLVDRRLAQQLLQAQVELADAPASTTSYAWRGPLTEYASEDELFAALTAVWVQSSVQMHRLASANGIRYLHVLQPNQYLPGSKPMNREERRIAYDPNNPYRHPAEVGYPRLIAAGRELAQAGVPFLDATALFQNVQEPLYIDSCCHFNQRGNELLADAIARALAATP